MHRAQQEQPAVLPAMLGRTNQLEPVATKEQNQTRRKRLLQRSCPLTKQTRGGGSETPLPSSCFTPHPASSIAVSRNSSCCCVCQIFTKPQLLHTSEGRLGGAKGCFETPGPPQSSTEPSPGTGTWHKLGVLRFEEASSVPCSLEQA